MNLSQSPSSSIVKWSLDHPKKLFGIILFLCFVSLSVFPLVKIDTNPKNMLPPTSEIRVWNKTVEEMFGLHEDIIVIGVSHATNIINQASLNTLIELTNQLKTIPGVAARDITGIASVDNIEATSEGLEIKPLITGKNLTQAEIDRLDESLFGSNLFVDRLISQDKKTTMIYVPLEGDANGKDVADQIRELTSDIEQDLTISIAGDPVARDTFGSEMFKLMAIFSPIAGGIMCLFIYFMFRSVYLVMTMMAVAMTSILVSLGALIGLGYPIHIMSSMAPVFLMAIATDSIHIFNEFYFRLKENSDRRTAIIETMKEVAHPVQYTALATAAGFAVLMFMEIIPVKVFGGLIVFGTLILRFLSFTLIPAMLQNIPQSTIDKALSNSNKGDSSLKLEFLGRMGALHPVITSLFIFLIFSMSVWGITKLNVNNNQLEWFTSSSEIRKADNRLNAALGGTALGYFVVSSPEVGGIKTPETLEFISNLQKVIEVHPDVGRTFSVVDYVKRIHQVLNDNSKEYYAVPNDPDTVGQYLFLFGMSARPSDLNNVVDYPYQNANIWVQLKTWDVSAMERVTKTVDEYLAQNPQALNVKPAGIAQFNVVWNQEVLWDMLKGFILALFAVFIILTFNFRSWRWALIGFAPLAITISLIYGVIGWSGKDFDMPISVLSCLSLGMAVDFSIHFISRLRQRIHDINSKPNLISKEQLTAALVWTAGRPGKGILRNAILFAAAFSVMMLAPLTPYITVGAFIVAMMMISALTSIIFLPAIILIFRKSLFK